MFCVNCGQKLVDGAGFCHECGTKKAEPNNNQEKHKSPNREGSSESVSQNKDKEYLVSQENELVFRGRRALARGVDQGIFVFVCLSCAISLGLQGEHFAIPILFFSFLLFYIWESLLIYSFGTTVSKAVFGIRVVNENDVRPSLSQSLKRSLGVWLMGVGLNIPILDSIVLLYNFVKVADTKVSNWDRAAGTKVLCKHMTGLRVFSICIYLLSAHLLILILIYSMRG